MGPILAKLVVVADLGHFNLIFLIIEGLLILVIIVHHLLVFAREAFLVALAEHLCSVHHCFHFFAVLIQVVHVITQGFLGPYRGGYIFQLLLD